MPNTQPLLHLSFYKMEILVLRTKVMVLGLNLSNDLEVLLSASGPATKVLEYLSFSDRNTCLFCSIAADIIKWSQVFSTRLLTLPPSFACAACVKTQWRTSRRRQKLSSRVSTPRSKQLDQALHSIRFRSYPSTWSRTWRACLQ